MQISKVSHRSDAVPVDDLGDFQAAELARVGDGSGSLGAVIRDGGGRVVTTVVHSAWPVSAMV